MNYYKEIKTEIINNEITKKIKDYSKNKSDLTTYYNVGKLLSEAGKRYGEGIIKEYSKNLTWSHYLQLLSFKDKNKINYYIDITIKNNLSKRQLCERIKNNEYERLDDKTKQKLIEHKETKVEDLIKNPIVIRNSFNYEIISEKMLQKLILEDIPFFLRELGNSFCFISNEYKIKMGNTYNYIDLLLYNIEFNCYVVVELKVTELKKEHIGQIEVYMNYIDKNLKTPMQNKTIGIIICKKDNRFIIEYCSDERITVRKYELI